MTSYVPASLCSKVFLIFFFLVLYNVRDKENSSRSLCGKRLPFPRRRSPVLSWHDRFCFEGIVACPFQAWNNQLLGWCPGLARDDEVVGEIGEDETFGFCGAVVLDDEFVDEDHNYDDDYDEDCLRFR